MGGGGSGNVRLVQILLSRIYSCNVFDVMCDMLCSNV